MKIKFPQTDSFWQVCSEGDVMPPHIFDLSLRFNSDGYVELLNTMLRPLLERVAAGRPCCVAVRLISMPHLQEVSEMVVR